MRLIDAEAFEKSVRTDFWEHYTDCHDTDQTDLLELIMDNLAEQPTIEAKPVVHAHWKEYWDYNCDNYSYCCSNCGKDALTKEETMYDQVLTEYCPCCGAQMDGSISCSHEDDTPFPQAHENGVKIPVISMEDVPKIMEEMEK